MTRIIQIISAPSVLGLKPGGVEHLGERLLATGLPEKLQSPRPVIHVPTLNDRYSFERDKDTGCLNPLSIHNFSLLLIDQVTNQLKNDNFPLVLGGDCSILLGILPALKKRGKYGLIFIDAHADFYAPAQSITGEVADMDLAIVTGRGPDILTDIANGKPYVEDDHVIHIGQRDAAEAARYGSQDIGDTSIKRFDLENIERNGFLKTIDTILTHIDYLKLDGFWIHFDTDVLHDDENPAVDYRLPGGLRCIETSRLLNSLLSTGKITGMSVTIFNPWLDTEGTIALKISACIAAGFSGIFLQDSIDRA